MNGPQSRRARLAGWFGLMLAALGATSTRAQAPLVFDDFDDHQIDPSRWTVTLPFSNPPPSTAKETNGYVELFRRGILESTEAFPSAIDIEGRFRFAGDSDTLSIVFRSDLTVTNQAERRGVQAALQQATGRVFLIPEPFATTPIAGVFTIGKDTNVHFRVTDNGSVVRLFVQDLFQPVLSVGITNRRGDRLAVYNLNGTVSRTRLDQLAVYPLHTSVFFDDALVRTSRVQRSTPVRVKLQSVYTNNAIYYTLDGSPPSFLSSEYAGPFVLSNSATVRAVAYTSDFLQSSDARPIQFEFLPVVRLTNETSGGGLVTFDPPGPHLSNAVVSLNAVPGPGWQFVRWEGAVSGSMISNQVVLTNHLAVRAVFATAPVLSTIGQGQIQTFPAGPLFDYGTVLRLMAVPGAGQYFFRWANAVTGGVSPATLTVTNASPSVSALFGTLASTQASLVILVNGRGTVSLSPPSNVLTNGQAVTATAIPDLHQVFLGWSGTATSVSNPLSFRVEGEQVLTARFAPGVRFDPAGLILDATGFRLPVTGEGGFVFDLQRSSNLVDWTRVATLTNVTGQLLYHHREATAFPALFYRAVEP